MQFHETPYGARFFNGQLPKLIEVLSNIASALKAPKPVYQLQPEVPKDFLANLYHGNYDPSDLPATKAEKELMSEILACQKQLRETVRPETLALIEQYRTLLNRRHTAEREQAFAAGFQSAMMMLAAGLACPAANTKEVCSDGQS